MEALIRVMMAAGPSAKRPPHMVLRSDPPGRAALRLSGAPVVSAESAESEVESRSHEW